MLARQLLMAFSGVFVVLFYAASFALIRKFHPPLRGDIGYGIWVEFTSWALVILLPLSIWLGELWFKRTFRSWIPQFLLLAALLAWSADVVSFHPLRAGLFLACVCSSLLYRFIVYKAFPLTQ